MFDKFLRGFFNFIFCVIPAEAGTQTNEHLKKSPIPPGSRIKLRRLVSGMTRGGLLYRNDRIPYRSFRRIYFHGITFVLP